MATTVEEICKRAEAAKGRKQQWDTELQDCYKYIVPGRDAFWYNTPGDRDNEDVFDDTAPNALRQWAGMMQNAICRPYTMWAKMAPGTDVEESQHDELRNQLAPLNKKIISAIWHSNFDSQVLEMFYDLGISTGALLCLDGGSSENPIHFQAVPLNEIFPEPGAKGTIETCFRYFNVAARNIMEQWPEAKPGEKLLQIIKERPGEEVEIIEAVVFEPGNREKKDNYKYSVVFKGDETEVYTEDMEVSPWIIPRMDVRPGETLGRGPGWSMLPTVKTLNQAMMYTLMNAEMSVSNIYTVLEDGVINVDNIELVPNSLIPVRSNGGTDGASIMPLPRAGDFNLNQIVIADLQQAVKDAFLVGQLGQITDPTKSATEMTIRNQVRLQELGVQTGRLITEFVNKTYKRVYHILSKYNEVPKDLKLDGKTVSIAVEGTMAQAQALEGANAYINFLQTAAAIQPELAPLLLKPDTIQDLGDAMGVPDGWLPDSTELDQAVQNIQQAQQQQQEQEAPPTGVPPQA